MKYSVLMSVYIKESSQNLRDSVRSMFNQTIPPDEVVLVIDGPLSDELYSTIEELKTEGPLVCLPLTENVGLGSALSRGVLQCKNEFIARMDSDDISLPERCEKQLKILTSKLNVSVVGSHIGEFLNHPSNIIGYRKVPLFDEQIKSYIKRRNPFNHPSVMFRKKDVLMVGNYRDFKYAEDYFLWIRLWIAGSKFTNIDEVLLLMRVTDSTYVRRRGWDYFKMQVELFGYMRGNRMISYSQYFINLLISISVRQLPNPLIKKLYQSILRRTSL
ncbi:glycosyltransferase [Paenibacillus sp. CAU 1782]